MILTIVLTFLVQVVALANQKLLSLNPVSPFAGSLLSVSYGNIDPGLIRLFTLYCALC